MVASVGLPLHVPGGVAGCGRPLSDHPEGADLRADRRPRRRPYHVAARTPRRRAQLGLPLLLVAGRHLHPRGAAAVRLHGRGEGVAAVADPRRRRQGLPAAHHVRPRRRTPAARAGIAVAGGLRGLEARPDRKRGARSVPARRVRRGDRLPASGPALRARLRAERLADRTGAARPAGGGLGGAGRGHLGGARSEAPLHPLQGDGVGCLRPSREGRRAVRSRRAGRTMEAPSGRGARGGLRTGVRPGAKLVRAVSTGPGSSTPAC